MLPICHDLRFVSTRTFLPRFPGERSFELKQHVSNACLSVLGALAGQLVILNHNAFARLRKNDSITRSQHEPPPQNKSKQGTLHGNLVLLKHSQKKKKTTHLNYRVYIIISSRNATSESRIHHPDRSRPWVGSPCARNHLPSPWSVQRPSNWSFDTSPWAKFQTKTGSVSSTKRKCYPTLTHPKKKRSKKKDPYGNSRNWPARKSKEMIADDIW